MKVNKILVLSTLLLGALFVNVSHSSSLVEQAYDVNNNSVAINLRKVQIGENDEVSVSKTFVQYGMRDDNYVLRFATAVAGAVEEITYTRVADGFEDNIKEVTHVYQGLNSGGETVYYNPTTEDLTTDETYKDMYYWACYTVEYTSDAYKDLELSVFASVKDSSDNVVSSTPRATSLNSLLDVNKQEYSIAGEITDDSFIYSAGKNGDNSATVNLRTYSTKARAFFKVNLNDILSNSDFETYKNEGKFEMSLAISVNKNSVTNPSCSLSACNVKYDDNYTAGIDFSTINWNTVHSTKSEDYKYSSLNIKNATALFETAVANDHESVSIADNKLTLSFTYEQIKDFICTDEGDNYGYIVFKFRTKEDIRVASLENTEFDVPAISFVYEK